MLIPRLVRLSFLFVALLGTHVFAQYPYPDRPIEVRITGALLSVDQEKREDIITVNVFVKDQPRLLRIGKLEEVTQHQKDQAVEQDMLLRQIRMYGPTELIDKLSSSEVLGKTLIIEGRIDTTEKRFLVSSVQEGESGHTPTPSQ